MLIRSGTSTEEKGSVDMDDPSCSPLAAMLLHNIIEANLRAIAVGGYRKFALLQFVGNLRGHNCAGLGVLIKDDE
jgi:hypothetical protein